MTQIGLEPFPNGGLINMGVYGGTAQASKSSPVAYAPNPSDGAIQEAPNATLQYPASPCVSLSFSVHKACVFLLP